jgi:hypothetical protein
MEKVNQLQQIRLVCPDGRLASIFPGKRIEEDR